MKRGCLELFGIFFPTCSFRCRKQFLKKCHLRVLQWRPCARVCTAHIWATCTSRGSGKQHVPVVQNIGAVTAKHKKKQNGTDVFIWVYTCSYYFIRRDSHTQLGFLWISPFWTNQDDGFIPAEALLRILRAAKHSLAVSSREGSEGYVVCSVRHSSKMFKRSLSFGGFNSLIVFFEVSIYLSIDFFLHSDVHIMIRHSWLCSNCQGHRPTASPFGWKWVKAPGGLPKPY